MKKEWNNPTVSNLALKETKNHACPHRSDEGETSLNKLGPNECCPCREPGLASCTKDWKYIGVCSS